jgi:hypothetical protein
VCNKRTAGVASVSWGARTQTMQVAARILCRSTSRAVFQLLRAYFGIFMTTPGPRHDIIMHVCFYITQVLHIILRAVQEKQLRENGYMYLIAIYSKLCFHALSHTEQCSLMFLILCATYLLAHKYPSRKWVKGKTIIFTSAHFMQHRCMPTCKWHKCSQREMF